ncbi:MAG: 8-oxo-dGTP diphosphatase MutT [Gammaproteobacteria bacterium]
MGDSNNKVHVAVGVVFNSRGQVLVALRPKHADQSGLWEFPGGKVEPGETVQAALARELYEEVGIVVQSAEPLLQVPHHYPQREVLLDVWKVTAFQGHAYGREGQHIQWLFPHQLTQLAVPAANLVVVEAVMAESLNIV